MISLLCMIERPIDCKEHPFLMDRRSTLKRVRSKEDKVILNDGWSIVSESESHALLAVQFVFMTLLVSAFVSEAYLVF